MADWRDQLRPAQFRGATFYVDGSELEAGRRMVVHEFPQRAEPGVEDLGRRARRYRVQGFLLGDTYHKERDRLVRAVERWPVGYPRFVGSRLEHPYLGVLTVALVSVRVTEDAARGGFARVSLEFVEAPVVPTDTTGTVAAPSAKAELEADVAVAAIAGETEIAGENQPELVLTSTQAELGKVAAILAKLDVFEGPLKQVQAYQDGLTNLLGNASTLATKPAELVSTVVSTLDALGAAIGNAAGAFYAYQALFKLSPTPQAGTLSVSEVAAKNAAAVVSLAKVVAGARAVQYATAVSWPDLSTATDARDQVLEVLELEMALVGDATYQALLDLRARLVASVPPPGQQLPRVVELVPESTTTTVHVAYDTDGDLDQELALAERNRPLHPGFLRALAPLEVLVSE